uniref:Uncharacterized protein n=1 Tax=Arundo donax TaxID=35708 RepID=A0A0A9EY58_ARUDO
MIIRYLGTLVRGLRANPYHQNTSSNKVAKSCSFNSAALRASRAQIALL